MRNSNLTTKLFTMRCEHQRGMLLRILAIVERPGYELASVSQSATDIHGVVLVMVEARMPGAMVDQLLRKLERIVGVIDVLVSFGEVSRVGYFRVAQASVDARFWQCLQRCGAILVDWSACSVMVRKQGTLAELEAFYNLLEGPGLLDFCQQPVPVNSDGMVRLEAE